MSTKGWCRSCPKARTPDHSGPATRVVGSNPALCFPEPMFLYCSVNIEERQGALCHILKKTAAHVLKQKI